MDYDTDDGHVIFQFQFDVAISKILYGQYHTWDLFAILYVLGLKTKVFCRENNQIHFPMDKRLTVPK